ncbi:hypothetical protein [Hungatella sp.]|uniref:hypothetical protein n=1 Tax=Hungatella sp. TaxID=2613924 RepID=UPI0039917FDE
MRENRKKQEQEILEAAAGSVPKSEGKTEQNEAGEDELKEKDWRAPLIDDPQDPDALQTDDGEAQPPGSESDGAARD